LNIMDLIKRNLDFVITAILTAVVLFFAPFDIEYYYSCVNLPLLIKLFCLMAVVAGLREYGLLDRFWKSLLPKATTPRTIGRFFVFICFFSSMFITNDVALIIFVPLAIEVLLRCGLYRELIWVVSLETVAANMGSMLTPLGNPQNLFLYEHFHLNLLDFLAITFPVTLLCGIIIYFFTLVFDEHEVIMPEIKFNHLSRRVLLLLSFLFVMCILCVLRVISAPTLILVVFFFLSFLKGRVLLKVDFKLLGLFVLLFLLVGGLGRFEVMHTWPRSIIESDVFLTTVATCQLISNVPAAVMLSGFTADYRNLLLGVSIGGLGTLIASMASLISFKAYMQLTRQSVARYLWIFTLVNVLMLIVLCAFKYLLDLL